MSFRIYKTISSIPLLAALCATNLSEPASAQNQNLLPIQTNQINVTVTVVNDQGDPMLHLQRENFRVSVDDEQADIVSLRNEDLPASVGIVFDASGSAAFPPKGKSKQLLVDILREGLGDFFKVSNKDNEYFLIAFNDKPQLLLDWNSNSEQILDMLTNLDPQGNSAFYDACYLAVDKVQRGRYAKHVLIVISDGVDTASKYSLSRLRDSLKKSDVILYSFHVPNIGEYFAADGQVILDDLSSLTGGRAYFPRVKTLNKREEVHDVFAYVASELRHQYVMNVNPRKAGRVGDWRKIKVRVSQQSIDRADKKKVYVRFRENHFIQ